MKPLVFLLVGCVLLGCGPSNDAGGVKTPDDIVAEQEALAAEQEKKRRDPGDYAESSELTEDEKKEQWDQPYAELELRRAARSAETCPESVTEKTTKGRARVTIVFKTDGHVKEATVGDPYTETTVGKCVLRAMGAVIVRPYQGDEKTVEWEVDLTGGKKSGPAGGGESENANQ